MIWFVVAIIFLGPVSGIALARSRGGSGRVGGVVAGIAAGIAISLILNVSSWKGGMTFSWLKLAVTTFLYVAIEAFCGWLWGRTWDASRAKPEAAKPEGDRDWRTEPA